MGAEDFLGGVRATELATELGCAFGLDSNLDFGLDLDPSFDLDSERILAWEGRFFSGLIPGWAIAGRESDRPETLAVTFEAARGSGAVSGCESALAGGGMVGKSRLALAAVLRRA
jgi:hypothetical protein